MRVHARDEGDGATGSERLLVEHLTMLTLVDPNAAVVAAWREAFDGEPRVRVCHTRFEEQQEYDCIVSPANSFGIMDGGVDLAISRFFGWELMDRVQQRILRDFFGEQPVGTCILVETGHPTHPWLAHTPTMRVPLDIRGTDHVYSAMLAMLQAIASFNKGNPEAPIRSIACPGLGTATGRMEPDEAARLMALAWRVATDPSPAINWSIARNRQVTVMGSLRAHRAS
jgi:O-acetyl-ADP-ribose deacetylase (regulator of RNase III)